MNDRVDILLATYNGEKYVESQILSIIAQQYKEWILFVHDDGSEDRTVDIIKKMAHNDKRIVLIEDKVRCCGAALNFLYLLKYSTSRYIMFCDQDDIWFDNKIAKMIEEIKKCDNNKPTVIYCNAYVWEPNSNKNTFGTSILSCPKNQSQFLFCNGGMIGCTSIFNDEMRHFLRLWDAPCSMHDYLLQLIAVSFGHISYLLEPLMLYRQHEKSVTKRTPISKNDFSRLIRNKNISVVDFCVYNDVKYFVSIFRKKISEDDILLMNRYLTMPSKNNIFKLFTVVISKFQLHGSILRLVVKILLRPYIK